jgi:hypothetical protein
MVRQCHSATAVSRSGVLNRQRPRIASPCPSNSQTTSASAKRRSDSALTEPDQVPWNSASSTITSGAPSKAMYSASAAMAGHASSSPIAHKDIAPHCGSSENLA